MATQVFRVTRVLVAAASPVARLEGVDDEGCELRLEVPAALVERTGPPAAGEPLTTPPASQTRSGPEINDAFNTLLGVAPGKGSSHGR